MTIKAKANGRGPPPSSVWHVYILKCADKSKKYHYSKTCQGLRNCSTEIYKVTLTEAKESKRTLCGYED